MYLYLDAAALVHFCLRYVRGKPDTCKVQLLYVYRVAVPHVDMLQPEGETECEQENGTPLIQTGQALWLLCRGGKQLRQLFTKALLVPLSSPDWYQN